MRFFYNEVFEDTDDVQDMNDDIEIQSEIDKMLCIVLRTYMSGYR